MRVPNGGADIYLTFHWPGSSESRERLVPRRPETIVCDTQAGQQEREAAPVVGQH